MCSAALIIIIPFKYAKQRFDICILCLFQASSLELFCLRSLRLSACAVFLLQASVLMIAYQVVVLVLLLFGGKKIPELMKGLGTGIKEFKKGVKEEDSLEEPKKKD